MGDYALIGVTALFSAIATLSVLFLYEWLTTRPPRRPGGPGSRW